MAVTVMAATTIPMAVAAGAIVTVGPAVTTAMGIPVSAALDPAVSPAHLAVAVVMPFDAGAPVALPTIPAFARQRDGGGENGRGKSKGPGNPG